DGIRGRNVTGVQTCALPILREPRHDRPCLVGIRPRAGPFAYRWDSAAAFPCRKVHAVVTSAPASPTIIVCSVWDTIPPPKSSSEIGRASCRERVDGRVVGRS